MPKALLYSWASSPIVMPCTYGIGYIPINERNWGSSTGPSTSNPPIGLGRSSTITGLRARRAACIVSAIVETYVNGRTPTSCRSMTSASTRDSICRVGRVTRPNRLNTGALPGIAAIAGSAPDAFSPCSGVNTAVSCVSGSSEGRTMAVGSPSRVTAA